MSGIDLREMGNDNWDRLRIGIDMDVSAGITYTSQNSSPLTILSS